MDAKSKAEFINSVVSEQSIICMSCGEMNDNDALFCGVCGKKMIEMQREHNSAPAFDSVNEVVEAVDETESLSSSPITVMVEEPKGEHSAAPAFASVDEADELVKETESPTSTPAAVLVEEPKNVIHYQEPSMIFAQGLPSWSVEPPQIMVRRRKI